MGQCSLELEDNYLRLEEVAAAEHSHTLMAVGGSQDEEVWSGMVGVAQEDKGHGLKDKEQVVDREIGDIHHCGRGERGEGACDTNKGEGHLVEDHYYQTH